MNYSNTHIRIKQNRFLKGKGLLLSLCQSCFWNSKIGCDTERVLKFVYSIFFNLLGPPVGLFLSKGVPPVSSPKNLG